jgi:hypothetical protein
MLWAVIDTYGSLVQSPGIFPIYGTEISVTPPVINPA